MIIVKMNIKSQKILNIDPLFPYSYILVKSVVLRGPLDCFGKEKCIESNFRNNMPVGSKSKP